MQGAVQYLKHGKALCGKVFANFVETFNHLVDFTGNLKGDADVGVEGGKIHLDRSDPDHPVIRFSEGEGVGGSGGSGGGGDDPDEPESPEDVDPYEDDDDYDPNDEQDPWYEDPEDSPAPGDGGGGGCNDWSGDLPAGSGVPSGWSGDNCGSINDFSR